MCANDTKGGRRSVECVAYIQMVQLRLVLVTPEGRLGGANPSGRILLRMRIRWLSGGRDSTHTKARRREIGLGDPSAILNGEHGAAVDGVVVRIHITV